MIILNEDYSKLNNGQVLRVKQLIINGDFCKLHASPCAEEPAGLSDQDVITVNGDFCEIENIYHVEQLIINGDFTKVSEQLKADEVIDNGDQNESTSATISNSTSKVQGFGTAVSGSVHIGGNVVSGATVVAKGIVNINGVKYRGNSLSIVGGKKYIDGVPLEQCTPLE